MPSPSLSPTEYADLFIAAVEGGIGYWSEVKNYQWSSHDFADTSPDDDYACVTVVEQETDTETFVDSRSEVWHNAVAKAAEYKGQSLRGFHEDHDADSGDIAMQYAVLGEIVYG